MNAAESNINNVVKLGTWAHQDGRNLLRSSVKQLFESGSLVFCDVCCDQKEN